MKFQQCEELSSTLVHNLLETVKYLHDRHVIHRDIKPENILLSSLENITDIKLIDFGIARELHIKGKYKDIPGIPTNI